MVKHCMILSVAHKLFLSNGKHYFVTMPKKILGRAEIASLSLAYTSYKLLMHQKVRSCLLFTPLHKTNKKFAIFS